MSKVILTGILTWDGAERRSNRYGLITLDKTNYNNDATANVWVDDPVALSELVDKKARISVKVTGTRESGHLGDFFRQIVPTTPKVDDQFDLGEGTLRFANCDWAPLGLQFGLEPDDGRSNDWFDPYKLYQLHDQTVELTIEGV